MAWILTVRTIGPTKCIWQFSGDHRAKLIYLYEHRAFVGNDGMFIMTDELLPLLSEEEHAAAVAAAMNPPTDRSITKIYHNWQPPKGTPP